VGGKIAQVGQRLIDGVARAMAEDFFKRFDQEMQRRYPSAAAPAVAEVAAIPRRAIPMWVWIVGALLLAAIFWSMMR
jgi:uncharacterized protein